MAGDWIKMRTDLYRDPKVCVIAEHLEAPDGELAGYVNQICQRDMAVTRNVTRCATVGALVTVWGVTRHQGKRDGDDLRLNGVTSTIVDDIGELPGLGAAMIAVGWLVEDEDGIVFPCFFRENNTEPKKSDSTAADRQRRYRERKKLRDVARNVTSRHGVTRHTEREIEKERESNNAHANETPERDGPDGHFSRADELAFVIEWNALADRFPSQLVRHGSTELNKFDRDALAGRWAGTWAEDWPRFVARLEAGKLQKTAVTVKQVLQNDLMDREIAQDRPGIDDRGVGRVRRRRKRPASTTERPHANLDDEDLTIKIETTERFIGLLEAETSPTAEQLGKLTRAHAKIAELRAERDARRDESRAEVGAA